jgi:hypothetical protein
LREAGIVTRIGKQNIYGDRAWLIGKNCIKCARMLAIGPRPEEAELGQRVIFK